MAKPSHGELIEAMGEHDAEKKADLHPMHGPMHTARISRSFQASPVTDDKGTAPL